MHQAYPIFRDSNLVYTLSMCHLNVKHPSHTVIFICRFFPVYCTVSWSYLTHQPNTLVPWTFITLWLGPHMKKKYKSPSVVMGDLAAHRQSLLSNRLFLMELFPFKQGILIWFKRKKKNTHGCEGPIFGHFILAPY